MQDLETEPPRAAQVWLQVERNGPKVEDGEWTPWRATTTVTTDPADAATTLLYRFAMEGDIWWRVRVFCNDKCEGEPIFTARHPSQATRAEESVAELGAWKDSPDQGKAQEAIVLPFPGMDADTLGACGVNPGSEQDWPLDKLNKLEELTDEVIDEIEAKALRSKLTAQQFERFGKVVSSMHRLQLLAREQRSQDALTQASFQLNRAIVAASDLACEAGGRDHWGDTPGGLQIVAHAASAYSAAYLDWMLLQS